MRELMVLPLSLFMALGLAITLIFGASALNALSTNAVFNILFFLMLVIFAASFLERLRLDYRQSGAMR